MESVTAWLEVWGQRLRESRLVVFLGLSFYALAGLAQRLLGRTSRAWELMAQVHRTSRSQTLTRAVEPFLIRHKEAAWGEVGPPDRAEAERLLGIRIVVVKPRVSDDEKGVVLVKFSETIGLVARTFDLDALLQDYHLVLEPSWSGYCEKSIVHYTRFEEPIFLMAPQADDYGFVERLDSNFIPLRIGPSDWVDPRIAEPFLGREKRYDIVFNSNWKKLKRHYVLFEMMAEFRTPLEVVLIGAAFGNRTDEEVRRLARYYGVLDQLTFHQHIPFREVMRINCESRMAMLLSLKEGSNRAIAESLFCDIPAIVLEEHVGGITKNIVPETGRLVPEGELAAGVQSMLAELDAFEPRGWALEHISCFATSELLNQAVRTEATRRGEEWSMDIAPKANSPEVTFVDPQDEARLAAEHQALARYLRG